MPFGMVLMVDKERKRIVIIISPLDELGNDQAERFNVMGLSAFIFQAFQDT
ncbi:hypothetical protein WOLCODRAFT_148321 [Wolfiporia cocos MD-104 SS10]|uniref:Uncharacterized protein n=1 Tax=Wolfiporia cocos (strain MD-104) TaxID=742152 RepID=A0A2H3JE63_WOLCO|nr:hypothetical protein WOLCODRAFT_148321 [Wolfiporia cocos MD-104 SS10]